MRINHILIPVILILMFYQCSKAPEPPKELTREEHVKQFFNHDGSHYVLVNAVKKAVRDPKSFEHDETVWTDKGDHLELTMSFRSRNGFGGMTPGVVNAMIGIDGRILDIKLQE